jgi:two-component system, OmpR family, sensor kinase
VNSIRHRLLFWQIGALLISGLIVSVLTFQLAWNGFNRIRDYGLEQIAYSVVRHSVKQRADRPLSVLPSATTPSSAGDVSVAPLPSEEEQEEVAEDLGRFVSQIWKPNGDILYSSHEGVGPPMQGAGFHVVPWDQEVWRVYTVVEPTQVVQVAVTSSDRASSFAEMIPWLMVPMALLVLVMGLLIHTAVIRALQPLERMRRDIVSRKVTELHGFSTDDLPDELLPLGNALNQLLERVDSLLASQRQFVANAAHELNTPLAAVKLQAQLARRSQEAQRHGALDELDKGIERASHLVAQLLQMARLEPDVRQRQPETIRLDELAGTVVAAFSAQAESREIDLGLDTSDPVSVHADPAELRAMIDNLVDNALRHTAPGCKVDVRVRQIDDRVELAVIDNGPGIRAADRERVLERFVRLNPQDTQGSGLGLAIVQQIVRNKGGELRLEETPGGGLSVWIRLELWSGEPTH